MLVEPRPCHRRWTVGPGLPLDPALKGEACARNSRQPPGVRPESSIGGSFAESPALRGTGTPDADRCELSVELTARVRVGTQSRRAVRDREFRCRRLRAGPVYRPQRSVGTAAASYCEGPNWTVHVPECLVCGRTVSATVHYRCEHCGEYACRAICPRSNTTARH